MWVLFIFQDGGGGGSFQIGFYYISVGDYVVKWACWLMYDPLSSIN